MPTSYPSTLAALAAQRSNLYLQRGDVQAQSIVGQQQPWAQAAQQIGSTLGSLPLLIQQQQAAAQQSQLHQQQMAKNTMDLSNEAKAQAEQDAFQAQLSAPMSSRADLLERVRAKAPGHYLGLQKTFDEADEKAATVRKSTEEANASHAKAVTDASQYFGALLTPVAENGYSPAVWNLALQTAGEHFPEMKPELSRYQQQAQQGGPQQFKQLVDGLIQQNAAVSNARSTAQSTAAKLPGEVALSEIQGKQNAGMSPTGISAPQQLEADARAATLKQQQDAAAMVDKREQQRIELERQRVEMQGRALDLKGGAAVSPEDVAYFTRAYQKDPAMAEIEMKGIPGLKQSVMKALSSSGADVTKLTSQGKNMQETATTLLPMIDKVQTLAQQIEQLGLMGTVGGRWRRIAAGESVVSDLSKLTPEQKLLVGEFQTDAGLLISGIARAHGGARAGGSPQMIEQLDKILGAKDQDLQTYLGNLKGARDWMQNYAGMGGAAPVTPTAADPSAPVAFHWDPMKKAWVK